MMNFRNLGYLVAAVLAVGAFNALTAGSFGVATALAVGSALCAFGPVKTFGSIFVFFAGLAGLGMILVGIVIVVALLFGLAELSPTATTWLAPALGLLAIVWTIHGIKLKMAN